ncbi:hypothetical protein BC936DRAFT_139569 [Jimgerdemannia flammicorona]|uniref:Uncharacterized protein n=1 Tax=Jimgerdemannia flammicorona TaxID=994334 RepID=A0A433B9M8_9FUNG|nr:hypothetical protein BC936DRAFT_139569 [Jimgerdemannia flammicorona]
MLSDRCESQEKQNAKIQRRLPRLVPLNGRIVHLVHRNNELVDARGLGEHGVLTGLTAALETRLKLTLTRRDDEHADVSLRGA